MKVEVTVDVDGRMVRAEASGARPREAVDELVDRLARRLDRLSDRWDRGHVVRGRRRPRPTGSEGALGGD
ncbi:HPF/RaiA family ribosome-associated protein, partial [Salinifilum aidingensis]